MRTSEKKINVTLKSQVVKTLARVIADIKSEDEAMEFIKDFFSQNELDVYSKRLSTLYFLKKGRSYTNIKENLKVSSATIASVVELMDKPGIKLAIKKLEAEEWANIWAERIGKIVPLGKKG